MSKGTSIKDAIKQWEANEANEGQKVADVKVVKLLGLLPPIEKMDSGLAVLQHVEQLSLSTNAIDKIANLNGFCNLKILSLGRNNIKSFGNSFDAIAGTLEELWMSYNNIEKMKGIGSLKNLKVLFLSNNKVKDWKEFDNLNKLPALETLTFNGNPLAEAAGEEYQEQVAKHLTQIKKLDGIPVLRDGGGDEGEEED